VPTPLPWQRPPRLLPLLLLWLTNQWWKMTASQDYVQTPNSQQFLSLEKLLPLVTAAVMTEMAQGQTVQEAMDQVEAQTALNLSYHLYNYSPREGYYLSKEPLLKRVKRR
jgi:hypothetical protein